MWRQRKHLANLCKIKHIIQNFNKFKTSEEKYKNF